MNIDFKLDTKKIEKKLGLDANGRVQAIIDSSIISHLRKNMPKRNGIMSTNTRRQEPGLIVVATPYAHYMNEGIKFVMPHNGKSAYFNPKYGFWSDKGKKKVPSGEPLKYHGGANRGAHFVERTLNEDFKEILKDAKNGVKK